LRDTHAAGSSFVTEVNNPEFQVFLLEFESVYGESPKFLNYAATTLDAINILVSILKELDDPTDTIAIRDALCAIQNYDGYSGIVAFDENSDVRGAHTLFQFDGEKFVPLPLDQ